MLANSKHMSLNIKRFVIRTRAVDNYQFNLILPTATELTSGCSGDRLSNQPLTLCKTLAADAGPVTVPCVPVCPCVHVPAKILPASPPGCLRPSTDQERRQRPSSSSGGLPLQTTSVVDPLSCSERAMVGNLILIEDLSKRGLENKCQTLLPPAHRDLGMAASRLLQNCSCAAKQRGPRGSWWPIAALALLSLLGWWEWCWRARFGDTRSHTHSLAAPRPTALARRSLELVSKLPARFPSQKVGAEGG